MATKKKPLELQGLLGLTFDDAPSDEAMARAKEEQKVAGKYNRPSNRKKTVKKKPTPPSLVKGEEPVKAAPKKPQLDLQTPTHLPLHQHDKCQPQGRMEKA